MLGALTLAHLDVFDNGDLDAAAEALALSLWEALKHAQMMERFKKNALDVPTDSGRWAIAKRKL